MSGDEYPPPGYTVAMASAWSLDQRDQWLACLRCAVLVADPVQHDAWHRHPEAVSGRG